MGSKEFEKMSVEQANRAVAQKALKILRTPKAERPKVFNLGREILSEPHGAKVFHAERQSKRVPLHRQKWFRAMVDRLLWKMENGIYTPPRSEIVCDHQNGCRHRDAFHTYEFPTPSGHIPKSDAYLFIRAYGGKIICLGE